MNAMTSLKSDEEKFQAWARMIFNPGKAGKDSTLFPADKETQISFIKRLFAEFEEISTAYSDDQVAEALEKRNRKDWRGQMSSQAKK